MFTFHHKPLTRSLNLEKALSISKLSLRLLTRPQFKTCLYARSIYPMHHSHNSSHVHRYFLHPHFKTQVKDTIQVGTQSVVCLSGLEFTVKHTQTPLRFFCIYIYLHCTELNQNSACPTPTIVMDQ